MQFLDYITRCATVYYDGMVCKRDFLIHMTSKCSVADKTLGSTKSLLKYFTTLYLLKYKLEELSFTFSVFVLQPNDELDLPFSVDFCSLG